MSIWKLYRLNNLHKRSCYGFFNFQGHIIPLNLLARWESVSFSGRILLHAGILSRYNWLSHTYQKTHRILQRSVFGKWKYVSGNWLKYSEENNFLQCNITGNLVVFVSNISIRNNLMVSAISQSWGHQSNQTACQLSRLPIF